MKLNWTHKIDDDMEEWEVVEQDHYLATLFCYDGEWTLDIATLENLGGWRFRHKAMPVDAALEWASSQVAAVV